MSYPQVVPMTMSLARNCLHPSSPPTLFPASLRVRLLSRGLFWLLLLALSIFGRPCWASSASQNGPTDPKELEAFLDGFLAGEMERQHIPGLVFVMVKDGEIFFAKGWGYADLEKKRPVVPDQTIFPVASVSKLFTATAVMQLYERGLIDLNADVNTYLSRKGSFGKDFQLPATYPQPVTTTNLLTHTGGFDDRWTGACAHSEADLIPLGTYLAKRMPPRIMPPGQVISYSNHGYALAGYLVEKISGIPFARYVDENIFQPLGMEHSSFSRPARLIPDLAVAYSYQDGEYKPGMRAYLNIFPAASLITTATDISRFMIAHLQRGRYGDISILRPETAAEMHRQQFTHHPRLPGWTAGFYEHVFNGERVIKHDGLLYPFHASLVLLPEKNLGIFAACNGGGFLYSLAGDNDSLTGRFFDRYFPAPAESPPHSPPKDFQQRAGQITGYYLYTRFESRSVFRIIGGANQFQVQVSGDNTITFQLPGFAIPFAPPEVTKPIRAVEVEPLVFKRLDGQGYLVFRTDETGRVTHIFLSISGMPMAFEKVQWYETITFSVFVIFPLLLMAFLSGCIVFTKGYRRYRRQPDTSQSMNLALRWAILISALDLVTFLGVFTFRFWDNFNTGFGMPPLLIAMLTVPMISSALTIAMPVFTVLAWKRRYWSVRLRLFYSLVTLAGLAHISLLYHLNLLSFRW